MTYSTSPRNGTTPHGGKTFASLGVPSPDADVAGVPFHESQSRPHELRHGAHACHAHRDLLAHACSARASVGCISRAVTFKLRWIECCGDKADSAKTSVSREKQINACGTTPPVRLLIGSRLPGCCRTAMIA